MTPQPKKTRKIPYTDNGPRKAFFMSAGAHEYLSKIASDENKYQAHVVDEIITFLQKMRYRSQKSVMYIPITQETWEMFSWFDQSMTPEQIMQYAFRYSSSRPHTPAAPDKLYQNVIANADEIRAEERNQTLDEAISDLNRVSLTGFTKYTYRRYVLQQLNSLRHQSTEAPK
jgi:hypothetical protein